MWQQCQMINDGNNNEQMVADDALIVSRMKSSRMKSSSLILILEIAKEELSYTGVVSATESPMPKSEGVNQKKLC